MHHFIDQFNKRLQLMKDEPKIASEFHDEMRRFLTEEQIQKTLDQPNIWPAITNILNDISHQIKQL